MADKKPPFVIEGDLLVLWQEARGKYLNWCIANKHTINVQAEHELKPSQWLKTFQDDRHNNSDKFSLACGKVGRHLESIQRFVQIIGFTANVVCELFPDASPASVVVNAFALLFKSFSKVSAEFDKIEAFFRRVADRLPMLSDLSECLEKRGKRSEVHKYIVNAFISCLAICQIGSQQAKSRIGTWLKQWRNSKESTVDPELEKFDQAFENLFLCIGVKTYGAVCETRDDVRQIKEHVFANDRDEMLDWMSSLNPFTMHQKIEQQLPSDFKGGRWLRESEPFRSWKEKTVNQIWYTGKPGAGKSVLAYTIVNDLRSFAKSSPSRKGNVLVACLYLSYTSQPDIQTLLGSILRQFQEGSPPHPKVLEKFKEHRERGRFDNKLQPPSMNDILQMLSAVAKDKTAFVIVDALDESKTESRPELLECIKRIDPNVKMLVTSRILYQLETLQKGFKTGEIYAHDEDIDEYIESDIKNHTILSTRKDLYEDVKRKVKHRSGQMFIIVRLHMAAIRGSRTVAELKRLLKNLPNDLDGAYRQTMDRINNQDDSTKSRAVFFLGWVAFSQRLLSTDELLHALAIHELCHDSALERYYLETLEDYLHNENEIISDSCGLLTTLDGKVRYIHRSTEEFFSTIRDKDFPNFDKQITLDCINYLITAPLQSKPGASGNRLSKLDWSSGGDFPLLRYTGQHLHRHHRRTQNLEKDKDVLEAIHSFVSNNDARELYSELLSHFDTYDKKSPWLINDNGHAIYRRSSMEPLSPLHIAVYLGNPGVVTRLIGDGASVGALDPYGQSALDVAIKCRLDTVASILVSRGAEIDLATRTGHIILHDAMEGNQMKLVKQIIGHSSKPLSEDSFLTIVGILYRIMLMPLEVFQPVLLPLLAAFRALVLRLPHAEALEASSVNSKVSQIADCDLSLEKYRELLIFAYDGDADTLKLLLEPSASEPIDTTLVSPDNNTDDGDVQDYYESDWDYHSDSDYVRFRSWDRSMEWRSLRYSRHFAGNRDSDLDSDAEASDDESGYNPHLGEDESNDNSDIVDNDNEAFSTSDSQDNDLDLEDRDVDNSSRDESKSMKKKTDSSWDLNEMKTAFLTTACFLAVENGKQDVVDAFLKAGVSPNLRNYLGHSLLHRATARGNCKLVKLLLNSGADVNWRDQNGRSALLGNAGIASPQVLKILMDHGAKLDLLQREGCHELYEAAVFGATEAVRFFLAERVNPSITNNFGWTPLHGAAANGHLECVRLLLESKANPSPVSDTGDTPMDLVNKEREHYDRILTGGRHYASHVIQAQEVSIGDRAYHRDEISHLLLEHKALTSEGIIEKFGQDELDKRQHDTNWRADSWWERCYKGPVQNYRHPGKLSREV